MSAPLSDGQLAEFRTLASNWSDVDNIDCDPPGFVGRVMTRLLDEVERLRHLEANPMLVIRMGEPLPPLPCERTLAEVQALAALHGWLHDPIGDYELTEACADFHEEQDDEQCKRLDEAVERRGVEQPGAAVRLASSDAGFPPEHPRGIAVGVPRELHSRIAAIGTERLGLPGDAPFSRVVGELLVRALDAADWESRRHRSPSRRAPEGFTPTADHAALAARLGLSLASEFEEFTSFEFARHIHDWNRAFDGWLLRAARPKPTV